ncbi:MAG: hypothetical protein RIS80_1278 [Actinomycetota bacterium]
MFTSFSSSVTRAVRASLALLLAATAIIGAVQVSPADAASTALICSGDNTRICAPVTNLKLTDRGTEVSLVSATDGTAAATLSSDAKDIGGVFKSSSDYAGKFVHIQFFDITKGMTFAVQAGAAASSTACDPGPASGNGCYLKLDSSGSGTFNFSVGNVTTSSKFSIQISGSAGWVSKAAVVSFDTPTKIAPSANRVATGICSKPVKLSYLLTDKSGAALANTVVALSTSGVGKLVSASATSDAKGAFDVNVTSGATEVGVQTVTLTVTSAKGLVSRLSETITWKPAPTYSVIISSGQFKVRILNAAGMPVLVKYASDKWVLVLAKTDSENVIVKTAKGNYSVTVQIDQVKSTRTVAVP